MPLACPAGGRYRRCVDTELTTDLPARGVRSGALAVLGLVLVVAVMVPPLATIARRNLVAESIQFCVLAMVGPALIVLGAQRRWPSRGRAGWPLLAGTVLALGAWIGACLVWRLPPVLDALARHPALAAAELVTLLLPGIGLWLELVSSPPSAPGSARPWRALVAALAMWSMWIIAYLLGFARGSVVHAYGAGGSLGMVNDQEITAVLLWLVSTFCFAPLIFVPVLAWLRDGADSAEGTRPRMSGGVRGWTKGTGRTSAGQARR